MNKVYWTVFLTSVLRLSGYSDWCDPDWSYRKPVIVYNTKNSDTLTDYQVKIDVTYNSNMNSDFSDLRFTDSDEVTLIPYWIENYIPSDSAIVWVKVPLISALDTTIIYMYYGNPDASSESNGDSVFNFFDDFDTETSSQWTTSGGIWAWVTDSSYVKVTGEAIHCFCYRPETDIGGLSDYVVETKSMRVDGGTGYDWIGLLAKWWSESDAWWAFHRSLTHKLHLHNGSSFVEETPYNTNKDEWYRIYLKVTDSEAKAKIWKPDGSSESSEISHSETKTGARSFGLFGSMDHPYGDVRWDWIFIRKYTDPEPTVEFGEEECLGYILVEPDQADSTLPDSTKVYPLQVINRGKSQDTIDITISGTQPDWTRKLYDSGGVDTLEDHDGDGIPDIEVASVDTTQIIAKITPSPYALVNEV
ncbi:DUF2341 domain-containing protein, partial [candidate division WOR-3 bacterium]|nr:DUF2341 domain-containing protein [candidate division WOR-3 bacterium]